MKTWTAIDLFSGAGGMSAGFAAHPDFRLVGAADGEIGKPSTGFGALQCNTTYEANIGVVPVACDLGTISPRELRRRMGLESTALDVLIACPPCTGFSRVNARNHDIDDPRNSLVSRTAAFVQEFEPKLLFMENARELLTGSFTGHFTSLAGKLKRLGYQVHAGVHLLTRFGLPQQRERAVVIAAREGIPLKTLDDLWRGFRVKEDAVTVRRAIGHLPPVKGGEAHPDDPLHVSTAFSDELSLARIAAMPHDGGSWLDLVDHPRAKELLIPTMWRGIAKHRTNQHCDIYGRLAWDRPAATIKRECCHGGNGRYSHPVQDRLCTVREMALLQGFPRDYKFVARSRKNLYRHIGDAVPPLISHQLAHLAAWMLTGEQPPLVSVLLPRTHLRRDDIEVDPGAAQLSLLAG